MIFILFYTYFYLIFILFIIYFLVENVKNHMESLFQSIKEFTYRNDMESIEFFRDKLGVYILQILNNK
jgi:hypothetical protein